MPSRILEPEGRDRIVSAPERGIDQHVLAVQGEAPVGIDAVGVARHAVGVERPVRSLERVPETEHASVGDGLGGRIPGRSEVRAALYVKLQIAAPRARAVRSPREFVLTSMWDRCSTGVANEP